MNGGAHFLEDRELVRLGEVGVEFHSKALVEPFNGFEDIHSGHAVEEIERPIEIRDLIADGFEPGLVMNRHGIGERAVAIEEVSGVGAIRELELPHERVRVRRRGAGRQVGILLRYGGQGC